jgi:hypothetical protein
MFEGKKGPLSPYTATRIALEAAVEPPPFQVTVMASPAPDEPVPLLPLLPRAIAPSATPVPESDIVRGELVASLVMVSVPAAVSVAVVANRIVYCAVAFGARTSGYDGWLAMLKDVPAIDAALIVTGAVPILATVVVSVLLCLTVTFPKARLAGDEERTSVATTPVPDSETTVGEFVASLVTVSVALATPITVGMNFTMNCLVSPGCTVVGNDEGEKMEKPGPVMEAALMVTLSFPVLIKSTVAALSWFSSTFPKARLADAAESVIAGTF